jgi:hypothetical protein
MCLKIVRLCELCCHIDTDVATVRTLSSASAQMVIILPTNANKWKGQYPYSKSSLRLLS